MVLVIQGAFGVKSIPVGLDLKGTCGVGVLCPTKLCLALESKELVFGVKLILDGAALKGTCDIGAFGVKLILVGLALKGACGAGALWPILTPVRAKALSKLIELLLLFENGERLNIIITSDLTLL
jgi:hypothetical protein